MQRDNERTIELCCELAGILRESAKSFLDSGTPADIVREVLSLINTLENVPVHLAYEHNRETEICMSQREVQLIPLLEGLTKQLELVNNPLLPTLPDSMYSTRPDGLARGT